MYDARTAHRWNIDPILYPWHGGYTVFNGNPILYADPDGLVGTTSTKEPEKAKDGDTWTKPRAGQGVNWNYKRENGEWIEQGGDANLNEVTITEPRSAGANPKQTYGDLYQNDNGSEAIFPKGWNVPSGWNYKGTDFFSTKGRTNVPQLQRDYPNSWGMWMPKTKQGEMVSQCFRDGGRDAVIGVFGTAGAMYGIGYAPVLYAGGKDAALNIAFKIYYRWHVATGFATVGGAGTNILLGSGMEKNVIPNATAWGMHYLRVPALISNNSDLIMRYNRAFMNYHLNAGSNFTILLKDALGYPIMSNPSDFVRMEMDVMTLYYQMNINTLLNTFGK